jgi:Arm DNA-binding domain
MPLPCFALSWGYHPGVSRHTPRGDTPNALSEFAAKNAKPKEKPYKLSDSGGLYLHI